MSERNPRLDPRPGDVLRSTILQDDDSWRVVIRLIGEHRVEYKQYFEKPKQGALFLRDQAYIRNGWRDWAASAEVVRRGDE